MALLSSGAAIASTRCGSILSYHGAHMTGHIDIQSSRYACTAGPAAGKPLWQQLSPKAGVGGQAVPVRLLYKISLSPAEQTVLHCALQVCCDAAPMQGSARERQRAAEQGDSRCALSATLNAPEYHQDAETQPLDTRNRQKWALASGRKLSAQSALHRGWPRLWPSPIAPLRHLLTSGNHGGRGSEPEVRAAQPCGCGSPRRSSRGRRAGAGCEAGAEGAHVEWRRCWPERPPSYTLLDAPAAKACRSTHPATM